MHAKLLIEFSNGFVIAVVCTSCCNLLIIMKQQNYFSNEFKLSKLLHTLPLFLLESLGTAR